MLYTRETNGSVQDVVERLGQSVKEHHFGVLGQIDLKAKMADKGVPSRNILLFTCLFFVLFVTGCSDDQSAPHPADNPAMESGLITLDSPFSFEETGSRIRTTLEERDLLIPADINHQQNAANVDMELLPTRVIIFGNPNLGTPLMQCSQRIAIDLPQKILIWEDTSGAVHVAYNDPNYLKQRHGAEGCDEAFDTVAHTFNGLVEAALSE